MQIGFTPAGGLFAYQNRNKNYNLNGQFGCVGDRSFRPRVYPRLGLPTHLPPPPLKSVSQLQSEHSES